MPIYKLSGKKDGRQKYRVRANYVDRDGKYRQAERVTYGADNAKALEMQLLDEFSISAEVAGNQMTLQELHDVYMSTKKHEIRETTLDKHRRTMEGHVLPTLGATKLKKLNIQSLQKWKTALEESALGLRSKQNIYATLRTALNFAVKYEYLSRSPLDKLDNFKDPLAEPKSFDFYTADEFKAFISAAHDAAMGANALNEWGFYIFFMIAFYCGMRKGEINALRWCDIDGNQFHVRRSVAQKLKGEDRFTPPKNKQSYRTIQAPKPLLRALSKYKTLLRKNGITIEDELLVCGLHRPLRDTTIEKRNKHFAEVAGLKKIRIHDFRHSHASLLANNGINIQEISRRLGHAKIEITWNTYSHLYPRENEKAMSVLDKVA